MLRGKLHASANDDSRRYATSRQLFATFKDKTRLGIYFLNGLFAAAVIEALACRS